MAKKEKERRHGIERRKNQQKKKSIEPRYSGGSNKCWKKQKYDQKKSGKKNNNSVSGEDRCGEKDCDKKEDCIKKGKNLNWKIVERKRRHKIRVR